MTFVSLPGGEVIPIPTYYTRIISTYSTRSDFYALEYGEGEVIDAGLKGNVARFINRASLYWLSSCTGETEIGLN